MLKPIFLKHSSMFLILNTNESNGITYVPKVKHSHKYLPHSEQYPFILDEAKRVPYV